MDQKNQFAYKDLPKILKIIVLSVGGISVLIIGSYILRFINYPISQEATDWASFGDYIGGILSPLFAAASFFAIIITLLMQMKELELQRKEFELQRDEMRLQRKVMELTREEYHEQIIELDKQNLNIRIQRFENTLFSLINRQQSIIENIRFSRRHVDFVGREVLEDFRNNLGRMYSYYFHKQAIRHGGVSIEKKATPQDEYFNIVNPLCDRDYNDIISRIYSAFLLIKREYLAHYFEHLYQIIKFIDSYTFNKEEEKQRYFDFFKSELSYSELYLIFLHGLQDDSFREMVNKTNLIDSLSRDELPNEVVALENYPDIHFR